MCRQQHAPLLTTLGLWAVSNVAGIGASIHVSSPADDATDAAHKHCQRRRALDAVHERIADDACALSTENLR